MYEVDEKLSQSQIKEIAKSSEKTISKSYRYYEKIMNTDRFAKGRVMHYSNEIWSSTPSYEYRFHLCKELAETGYPYAFYRLGKFYENGRGVEQNEELARKYLLEAYKRGDDLARKTLGMYYLTGYLFERDPDKAQEIVAGSKDEELIRLLNNELAQNDEDRCKKAREYYEANKYQEALCLYNGIEVKEDTDKLYLSLILKWKNGYSNIVKAHEFIKELKEKNYTHPTINFKEKYDSIENEFEKYMPHSIIGHDRKDEYWKMDRLNGNEGPHFWYLFNQISEYRNKAYYAGAQYNADWLYKLYPDSGLAKLACLLAYAGVSFEKRNTRYFNMQYLFTTIQSFRDYACLDYFNEEQKPIVKHLLDEIEKRNEYNKKQLNQPYQNDTYWKMNLPVCIVSADDISKETGKRVKQILEANGKPCFFCNENNLLERAIGSKPVTAARFTNCELMIFISSSEKRNLTYQIWNHGDYYVRNKAPEYGKRLIFIGPKSKEELIGYRFRVDQYLDINDADLENNLMRAVNAVDQTRDSAHWYKQMHQEIIDLKSPSIDEHVEYAKKFCKQHNIPFPYPAEVKYNGIVSLENVQSRNGYDPHFDNGFTFDPLIKVEAYIHSFLALDYYVVMKLYDHNMNIVKTFTETSSGKKKKEVFLNYEMMDRNKNVYCPGGLYFMELLFYKGTDESGKLLGKVSSIVCLKYH